MNALQFIIHRTPNEGIRISAAVTDETSWLTEKEMAELFGVQIPAIAKHLQNICEEKELSSESTVSKMEIPLSAIGKREAQEQSYRQVSKLFSCDFWKKMENIAKIS